MCKKKFFFSQKKRCNKINLLIIMNTINYNNEQPVENYNRFILLTGYICSMYMYRYIFAQYKR